MKPQIAKTIRLVATCWCLVAGAALHAASPAETARDVTFEELESSELPPGARIRLSARYVELQGDELVLFGSPVRFIVPSTDVMRRLLEATVDASTLTIEAVRVTSDSPKTTFDVQSVSKGPSLAEIFARETEILRSKGEEGGPLLRKLAIRIRAAEEQFGAEELRPIAREACSVALRQAESRLDPQDSAGRLRLVREAHESFGDRRYTIALLSELEQRYPDYSPIREFLVELECRKFRGQWLTYEDFKREQGFVPFHRKWMTPREVALTKIAEEVRRGRHEFLVLRNRLDEEYRLVAQRGDVLPGMTRKEVQQALGHPERVYREKAGGREIDQWVYEDRLVYFLDKHVLRETPRHAAGDPDDS